MLRRKKKPTKFCQPFFPGIAYTCTPHFAASPGQQFLRIPCETKLFTPQRHGNILMLTSRPLQKRPSAFLLIGLYLKSKAIDIRLQYQRIL